MLIWQPGRGFAADLIFSGSLERVGHESISVRLPGRRVIDARLPHASALAAEKIAEQYTRGDQVQITCKPIKPVWEEDTSRYQSLEVTKLQFLRKPSVQELSEIPELPAWREGVDLLTHPARDPQRSTVGNVDPHAREVNLQYASNMPNFVADETAKRYSSDGASSQWRYLDTIETEIAFHGSRVIRRQVRKDGKPWDRPFQALPGFKWSGGFGGEIRPLFDSQCPTTIEFAGAAEVRGKKLLRYRFSSPPDGCFVPFYLEYQRYNPARTGYLFLDDPDGRLIQLEEDAGGFPPELEFAERKEEVSWDYVKIGDASHLLPVEANFVVSYSSGSKWRIEVEYKNHRHFEASTNITFK